MPIQTSIRREDARANRLILELGERHPGALRNIRSFLLGATDQLSPHAQSFYDQLRAMISGSDEEFRLTLRDGLLANLKHESGLSDREYAILAGDLVLLGDKKTSL